MLIFDSQYKHKRIIQTKNHHCLHLGPHTSAIAAHCDVIVLRCQRVDSYLTKNYNANEYARCLIGEDLQQPIELRTDRSDRMYTIIRLENKSSEMKKLLLEKNNKSVSSQQSVKMSFALSGFKLILFYPFPFFLYNGKYI